MSELYHHGVLGMKWGVRRYQNKDGSLTEKGKARFKKVAENERLQKRDQKTAIKISKKLKKRINPEGAMKITERQIQKELSKKTPNKEKLEIYNDTLKSQAIVKKCLDKRIENLETGKIKAGRDYIVQNDVNFLPLTDMAINTVRTLLGGTPVLWTVANVEKTIIKNPDTHKNWNK